MALPNQDNKYGAIMDQRQNRTEPDTEASKPPPLHPSSLWIRVSKLGLTGGATGTPGIVAGVAIVAMTLAYLYTASPK
jgi:hypothetical protein